MTKPSEESDNRAPDKGADNADRASGIYRRPRRRTDQDVRTSAGASDENRSDQPSDNSEPSSNIYPPPRRRRARRDAEGRKPGLFGRLTGRQRLDEIRIARYEPYTYESNEQNMRWVTVAMGLWCLVLVWLAFTDYSNSQRYQEWVDQGITDIPPTADIGHQIESARTYAQRVGGEEFKCAFLGLSDSSDECPDGEMDAILVSNFVEESGAICANTEEYTPEVVEEVPDDEAVTTGLQTSEPVTICTAVWSSYALLKFAEQAGLDCPSVDAIVESISSPVSQYPDCDLAFSYAEDFQRSQDRSRLIWLLSIFLIVVVAFPYLSLVHRASRNLLPLKSEGQKHLPEWSVLHHFIPILNFFRPGQMLSELYKGSDPNVTIDEPTAWKGAGKVPAIVYVWWALWVFALLFNPIWGIRLASLLLSIVGWIIEPIQVPGFLNAQSLPELIGANNLLILSDVLLIFLGIVAVLMLRQLHVWQEMRFSRIGLITVTPPPPVDPLAEALKKQEEQQRAKEERKNRRGR
ncbi:MAG: DUF4328 domain-containing protein [Chloroflexi bacterium]|nr:DUF4328 domain-containing protein [Chloroflexota bacterium]